MSKPIQMVVVPGFVGIEYTYQPKLIVLCESGSIWQRTMNNDGSWGDYQRMKEPTESAPQIPVTMVPVSPADS